MNTKEAHKRLVTQYHAVCGVLGLGPEEKNAIKQSYGVQSISELSDTELRELLARLDGDANRWRRRVMAVIGAYLRRINYPETADTIKAIACRAAGYKSFNRIPLSRLRAMYYEFLRQNRVASRTGIVIAYIEQTIAQKN